MVELQFTPYVLLLLMAAALSAVLAVIVSRRGPGPGVVPYRVLMSALVVWSLAFAGQLSVVDLNAKLLFSTIGYSGITTVPAAWLMFAYEYTGRGRWITRRNILLLAIEPVVVVVLSATSHYHDFFRVAVSLDRSGDFVTLSVERGPAFWIHAAYSYALLLLGTVALIQGALRLRGSYRAQLWTMIAGVSVPWLANTIFILGIIETPIDTTPFMFTLMGVVTAWSMYRYRLMDLVPVAQQSVIESLGDAVMALDTQNRVVMVNPAVLRLLELPPDHKVIGQPIYDVLAKYPNLLERFRGVQDAQTEVVLGEGDARRVFTLRITPLTNRFAEVAGRLFVMHEITELWRASERIKHQNEELVEANQALDAARAKAEEANRLKSEFLATMSHELRTPLNSVIGYADLMLTGLVGPMNSKQLDYAGRIVANGERLLSLINDILDISKIEAGRLELVEQPFSPGDLLARIHKRMLGLAEQKSLVLETRLDPDLPQRMVGDQQRLDQVLTNLVGNAIRFTEAGRVEVRFERSDKSEWVLAVTDTGRGIPPHALEFIFDEFRQVDGSSQREHGGTGLGLAIVRKLVVLMNGAVQVQSEVNQGSTFRVALPLVVPDGDSGGAPEVKPDDVAVG
ncbi:MAG: PAS domain-containing protein [Chloroflexi bacterium]|nr:PAS domain-containing protein [Chloroflexota bacterium]